MLLVEDDARMAAAIHRGLRAEGIAVDFSGPLLTVAPPVTHHKEATP